MESKKSQILQTVGTLVVIGLIVAGVVFWASNHKSASKPEAKKIPIGFHITHPDGWAEVKPTPEGTLAGFSAASAESDATGRLQPFITIQHTVLKDADAKKLTSEQIASAYVAQLPATYTNYVQQSVSAEKLDDLPATLVTFTSTQGESEVTAQALVVVKDQVVYSVNGETLTSTWPQHEAEIKQAILSFRP